MYVPQFLVNSVIMIIGVRVSFWIIVLSTFNILMVM